MQNAKTTVDPDEIARFSAQADTWWDERGPFAPLHKINPLRIGWIKERIQDSGFRIQGEKNASLNPESRILNPTLLDIGCGGGLICEPFARLGAKVTGIDASEKNIVIARLHAQKMGLDIDYRCATPESRILNPESYDIVTALEIVEHVADIPAFVAASCALVKPGGMIFMSTLNRTARSYALAIVGAEYVLRWLPRGTHTWSKFVRPHELVRELEKNGIEITDLRGMVMSPLTFQWRWDARDLGVNYALCGKKLSSRP